MENNQTAFILFKTEDEKISVDVPALAHYCFRFNSRKT